jgi:hypothetical protein
MVNKKFNTANNNYLDTTNSKREGGTTIEYNDESNDFWNITEPVITPPDQRPLNPTQEELIIQLNQYPQSYFDNAYDTKPVFNGSLCGYYKAVRGESSSVLILVNDRPNLKAVTKNKEVLYIECFQRAYMTFDDVPITDNYVSNKEQVLKARKFRAEKNKKSYDKQKGLSIAVSGSAIYKENTPNKATHNIAYRNNLMFIDFDFEFADDLEGIFEILKNDKYTKLVHKSFSGDGFAVVVEMSKKDANDNFKLIFKKLERYYKVTYDLKIDVSCSNINRLRYLSYDKDIFVKKNTLIEITQDELDAVEVKKKVYLEQKSLKFAESEQKHKENSTLYKSVSELVEEIISSNNKVVEGYINWFKIKCALHKYPSEWQRLNEYRNSVFYQDRLKTGKEISSTINIATFYYYCKKAGIEIKKYGTKNYSLENQKSSEGIDVSLYKADSDVLTNIENEINKYKRIEGEVLNGYLGDIVDQLIKSWSVSHINILNSPPSSGKTSMVLQLIKEGKRILLLVPTKAIIKNKKLDGVAQIFGDIDIKKYLNTTDSLICTFDKGSQLEVDDLLKFDYVIIDESHLLFTEDYRMNALVLLLKKIELYMQNMRKNLIALNSTKIILMSGTPTGEEFFFEPDEKGEQITHKKVFINNKERNAILVGCVDEDSCYTSFINKIIELINNGYRVFIPTDRGEKWINAVVGVVNGVIGRDIKFEIYSNNQKDSQANIDINANSIISDDNELLFSTSLGNAGIDINNTDKRTTMVIYTDKNNLIIGQKAIQYANRFRNENVQIIVFFILPKEIKFINQEFSFGYVEDPNEILCINNDISTQLYTNEGIVNMLDDFTVDKVKVKWKALQQKLEEHFSNIISIGGYFKTMGYEVTTSKGDKTDHNIIQSRKKINVILKQLEYDSKLKALAFILTNIDDLTESLSKYTRTKGEYSLIKETLILTLENEQIFNIVRLLIRKFTQITGRFNDVALIEKFMLNWKMNFKDIEHRLKFMEFVHNDCVDDLDNTMVKEVDQLVNLNKGVGSISKQRYNDILNILAPKYINKAFNELEQNKKKKLVENLKSKLNICYIIKIGKVVEFKQRFTEVWKNETICWFKDFNAELYTEAPVNERILRNRIGDAKGLAIGKAIGKAYEHISIDLIDNINRIVDADGYITAKNIIEITGLSSNSLGGFVKAKLQNLKSSVKMIKGARETRYN